MFFGFFFFNDTATTEIYTLSLHDALPIWGGQTVKLCHIFIGIRQPGTDLQSEGTQFPGMLSIFIAVHLYDVMANEAIKVDGQRVTTVIILPLDDTVVSDKFMTFI